MLLTKNVNSDVTKDSPVGIDAEEISRSGVLGGVFQTGR